MPVLVGGTLNMPRHESRPLRRGLRQPGPAARGGRDRRDPLQEQAARPPRPTGRNLPYEAATAVAFGLPEDEALKAVTLTPAQILGRRRPGRLAGGGKRANLVVTAGHILQPTTAVLALFIDGKPCGPRAGTRQLYARIWAGLRRSRAGPRLWAWTVPAASRRDFPAARPANLAPASP